MSSRFNATELLYCLFRFSHTLLKVVIRGNDTEAVAFHLQLLIFCLHSTLTYLRLEILILTSVPSLDRRWMKVQTLAVLKAPKPPPALFVEPPQSPTHCPAAVAADEVSQRPRSAPLSATGKPITHKINTP